MSESDIKNKINKLKKIKIKTDQALGITVVLKNEV